MDSFLVVTVQIDNYPLRRFFIKPCPFIYFEQMLLLMLSKETGEWCIVYNGITIFLFPSGEQDTLARFEPLFLEHYNRSFHFPGAHTPTAEEVKTWYVPLVEKLMMEYPASKDGYRYFGIDLDLSIHDGYNYMESINPYS